MEKNLNMEQNELILDQNRQKGTGKKSVEKRIYKWKKRRKVKEIWNFLLELPKWQTENITGIEKQLS